jgi:hypothetical protein
MSWYEIRLTRGQIRDGVLTALENEFRRIWQLGGEREDMALFAGTQHEKGDGQLFYISPGSLPWADRRVSLYIASLCEKPLKTEVRPKLLVGHPEAQGLIE